MLINLNLNLNLNHIISGKFQLCVPTVTMVTDASILRVPWKQQQQQQTSGHQTRNGLNKL